MGADANAFRPTTPGNSPGVGHKKFEEDKGIMKVKGVLVHSPDVKVSVAEGFENDFRPTDPGNSPGVGHPHENKSGQLN
ncbi:DNA-directed RNA polymerase II subunit RPB [Spatholobus suberectus]|nr:DNA-directed RNA polymerase II subunit RPB [Spatholobus suberectus]